MAISKSFKPAVTPPVGSPEVAAPPEVSTTASMSTDTVAGLPKTVTKQTIPLPKKVFESAVVIAAIKKERGDLTIVRGNQIPDVRRIPTGDFEFDFATGGGFPRGRYSIIFGPESSCLSGGTFIQYEIRTSEGKRQNHKGGTLENLYLRFNGLPRKGQGFYQRPSTVGSEFFAPSVNEEGRIIQNRILAVVKNGQKPVFKVTTQGGLQVIATADHRFLSDEGYVRLGGLDVGSVVMIHNNTPYRTDSPASKAARPALHVKYHPYGTHHMVNGYAYKYVITARLIYEARLNELEYDSYVNRLNSGDLTGLKFLTPDQHVHHRNENFRDNDEQNVVVLDASTHGRIHAWERHNNLRYTAVEDHIISIEPVGVETVYDIEMEDPYPNFVADGFVVHNCKTNLAYLAIAEAQRGPEECNKAVLVDLEGAFDPNWAVQFGIDVEALIVVKPGYGEEAVDIIDALVRAEDVAIIVVDSLATIIASKEIEQSAEKFDVGTSSLLIKRMCNKVNNSLSQEAKRKHDPCVIFINQIRFKIGVMFGNPETQPGGQAMKFLASLIVRVSGKNKIVKEYNPDTPVLKEVHAQIIKSKVGIYRSVFDFEMALQPHGDLSVGETDSWGMVKNELQSAGLLKKPEKGTGYLLEGKLYPTLTVIGDTYNAEKAFAMHLQDLVIKKYSGTKFVIDIVKKTEGEDQPKEESTEGV